MCCVLGSATGQRARFYPRDSDMRQTQSNLITYQSPLTSSSRISPRRKLERPVVSHNLILLNPS